MGEEGREVVAHAVRRMYMMVGGRADGLVG